MKRIFYSILFTVFILVNPIHAQDTAESLYAKAYGNIYKNDTKTAIKIFEKAIISYPDCGFLYAGMGDAYLKEGNYTKASDCYTNAQRKKFSNENYKIDFYSANLQKMLKDVNYAINSLFNATKNVDNYTVYKNINALINENYSNLSFLPDMYLNTSDDELNNINNLKNSGKKEDAVKKYLQILSSNPKNFQAANNLGVTLYELKDYQLAEKYLNIALENNKESAIIYNNLAIVELYLKKYKEMEINFEEAIKYNSNYIPAINNKAVATIHRDLSLFQTQNANSLLDIIKKDNENFYASRTLAKIYTVKCDYKNANNILEPLTSNYNFKIYTQKAFVAYKNNDYNNALQYINKAITMYSDNSIDYVVRGRIYTELGRYNEAKNDFNKALSKDKKNYMIYYYQAKMFNKTGDNVSAQNYLKQFVSLKKGNSQSTLLKLLLN